MFGRKAKRLQHENENLRIENDALRNNIASMQRHFDAITSKQHSCAASVDFVTMKAFSIERNIKDGFPVTIIGYWKSEDDKKKLGEWYIYCDENIHEKLVKQFDEAMK